jgi:hypothetical protein
MVVKDALLAKALVVKEIGPPARHGKKKGGRKSM